MKKSLMKRTAQLFLAFVCSFVLFVFLSLFGVRMTLMRSTFMQQQVNQSQYVSNIRKEMNTKIQDLARGSNISPEVVKDAIPYALIEKNMTQYVNTLYSGRSFTLQGEEEAKKELYKKINQYAADKKIKTDEQMNKGIAQFVDASMQVVKQAIEIPYLANFVNKVNQYKATLNTFIIEAGIAVCVIIGMLFMTCRSNKERISFTSLILAGTGLSLVVGPLIIYFNDWMSRIGIMTQSIYEFVQTYLRTFDLLFIKMGIILLVLSILFFVTFVVLTHKSGVTKQKT